MPLSLSCPNCSKLFQISAESADQVTCPDCGLNESADQFVEKSAGRSRLSESDSALANSLAPRRLKTAAGVQDTGPIVDNDAGTQPSIRVSGQRKREIDSAAVSQLSAKRQLGGRKRSPLQSIVILSLSVLSVGGLFALIVVLANRQAEDPSASGPNKDDAAMTASERTTAGERSSEPGESVSVPSQPLDRPPDFFKQAQWNSLWQKVNPYLVRLDIETPFGRRTATGLIVDSRGWVATSYAAIHDAGKVAVTVAGKKLGDESSFRDLTDDARGVVATSPETDLALIAVNRAQVLSLSEVELDDSDNVVASERAMVARVPPAQHRNWLTECRIDARRASDELPTGSIPWSDDDKTVLSSSLRLISFPEESPGKERKSLIGSPIFRIDGTVLGLNSGLDVPGQVVAVPAIHIRQLLQSVDGDVKPFPKHHEMIARSEAIANENETQRDVREQIEAVNEAMVEPLAICRATAWNPDDADEYESFQRLAENMIRLNQMAIAYGDDADVGEMVTRAIERLLTRISASLAEDYEPEEFESAGGGEQFESQVNRSNPWFIFFADVVSGAATSPPLGGQETVMLQIVKSDQRVLCPFYEELAVLRPGMRFMFVGRLDPRDQVRISGEAGADSIKIVNVLFSFQVSKP